MTTFFHLDFFLTVSACMVSSLATPSSEQLTQYLGLDCPVHTHTTCVQYVRIWREKCRKFSNSIRKQALTWRPRARSIPFHVIALYDKSSRWIHNQWHWTLWKEVKKKEANFPAPVARHSFPFLLWISPAMSAEWPWRCWLWLRPENLDKSPSLASNAPDLHVTMSRSPTFILDMMTWADKGRWSCHSSSSRLIDWLIPSCPLYLDIGFFLP